MDHAIAGGDDYFATYAFTDRWTKGGQEMEFRFWHRPLDAMVRAVLEAGFALETIAEPQPLPAARELFPEAFHTISTAPRFIFFSARKPG